MSDLWWGSEPLSKQPFLFAFLNVQGINNVCDSATPQVSTACHRKDTKIHYYYLFILAFCTEQNLSLWTALKPFLCLLAKTCILKAHKLSNIAYTNSDSHKNVASFFPNDFGEKRWIIVTHNHIKSNFYIHYHGLGSVTLCSACDPRKNVKS